MARKMIHEQPLTGADKQRRYREKHKQDRLKKWAMLSVIADEIVEAAKEKDSYGYVKLNDFTLLRWAKAINNNKTP